MKLFLLRLKRDWTYDETDAFVIRAETEEQARYIAAGNSRNEGKHVWLNPEYSICEDLMITTGESGVILESFNSG